MRAPLEGCSAGGPAKLIIIPGLASLVRIGGARVALDSDAPLMFGRKRLQKTAASKSKREVYSPAL